MHIKISVIFTTLQNQVKNTFCIIVSQLFLINICVTTSMAKTVQNYTLLEIVGEGMFGKVYRAINVQNRRQYAVKMVPLEKFSRFPKLEEYTINEINILRNIESHPHIIRYYQMLRTIYQFCKDGTLQKMLEKQRKLSERQALMIFRQLLQAFKILNKYNIIHRDLKPDNIFFNDGLLKIGDFGFCKDLNSSQTGMTQTMVGSPIYMAPQVLQGQIYSNKADIWSLGVLLYLMIYGRCPFVSESIPNLLKTYKTQQLSLQGPVSIQIKNILSRMLQKDHRRRISWIQIFILQITEDGVLINPQIFIQRTQSLHLLTLKPNLSTRNIYQNYNNNNTGYHNNYHYLYIEPYPKKQCQGHKYFSANTARTERSKSSNVTQQINKQAGKHYQKIQKQEVQIKDKEDTLNSDNILNKQHQKRSQVNKYAKGKGQNNKNIENIRQKTNDHFNPENILQVNQLNQIEIYHEQTANFQRIKAHEKIKIKAEQKLQTDRQLKNIDNNNFILNRKKQQFLKQHQMLIKGVKFTQKIISSNMKNSYDLCYIVLHQCWNKCKDILNKLKQQRFSLEPYQKTFVYLFENSLELIERQRKAIQNILRESYIKEGNDTLPVDKKIEALQTIAYF